MNVRFRTRRLERAYSNAKEAEKHWGTAIGRKYIQRIEVLSSAASVEDLYTMQSLNLHALSGDRSGQHAIKLTGNYRLVLMFDDDPRMVEVCDVDDYH